MLLLSVYFGLFAISLLSAECETGKNSRLPHESRFYRKHCSLMAFSAVCSNT